MVWRESRAISICLEHSVAVFAPAYRAPGQRPSVHTITHAHIPTHADNNRRSIYVKQLTRTHAHQYEQAKKDQMIARARTAKTSQKVNDMLSSMTGSTSMDAFERMKEKVRVWMVVWGWGRETL